MSRVQTLSIVALLQCRSLCCLASWPTKRREVYQEYRLRQDSKTNGDVTETTNLDPGAALEIMRNDSGMNLGTAKRGLA